MHEEMGESVAAEGDARQQPPRRSFMKALCAVAVGSVAVLAPLANGVYVLLAPLCRKQSSNDGDGPPYLRVTAVDAVPADGKPRRFPVIADREDAWNLYPRVPIGSVYLRRLPEDPDHVTAFNTVCPHAGCSVEAQPDASFECPCHDSRFHADGSRGDPCVAPRDLDELAAKIEGDDILVQFQNFEAAIEEKRAKV